MKIYNYLKPSSDKHLKKSFSEVLKYSSPSTGPTSERENKIKMNKRGRFGSLNWSKEIVKLRSHISTFSHGRFDKLHN